MGKGYTNYMCKKPFHPGSKANIKRAWMAEQKTESDKKKQEDLKAQYEKEQELYHNRALLSKESKDKLGLNFMYEAPPGAKKEHQKEDNEPEYKFEWQRKYNAPREDFARGNAEIRDQPFGIQVRNVRCIKCHKWGHINTDKECPLFHRASDAFDESGDMTPMELMRRMKEEEGLALKQTILGHRIDPNIPNQQMLPSDDEEDAEMQFLKTLSKRQKEKLLKKLEKLEKKSKKNEKSEKKSKKTKHRSSSSDSDNHKKKKHREKSRRKRHDTSESSGEESSDSGVEWTEKPSAAASNNHHYNNNKSERRNHSDKSQLGHRDSSLNNGRRKRSRSRSPMRKRDEGRKK